MYPGGQGSGWPQQQTGGWQPYEVNGNLIPSGPLHPGVSDTHNWPGVPAPQYTHPSAYSPNPVFGHPRYSASLFEQPPPSPNPELEETMLAAYLRDLEQHGDNDHATSMVQDSNDKLYEASTLPAEVHLPHGHIDPYAALRTNSHLLYQGSDDGSASSHVMPASVTEGLRTFYAPTGPHYLRQIDYLPEISKTHKKRIKIVKIKDKQPQQMINQQIFDGKLTWLDPEDYPRINTRLSSRSPYHQQHRPLPMRNIPAFDELTPYDAKVVMTDHIPSRAKSKFGPDPRLAGKVYHLFWGLPDNPQNPEVRLYGMGYLEPNQFASVDKHLKEVLQRFPA
ncbi:uncharacterized protein UTRI_10541 [Ustilago trichophora]|uniref:Uncharacterized protein n=1 Tax=Ustilago trichophora TaxID=86804 RepID=A0A5C3E9T2_9BASI|nr:uncharacterized protein UTRI_10541 [Ustilago trichophora]